MTDSANLFDQKTPDTTTIVTENKSYLDVLVGEDKKFKTVEDLAKGKYESDERFIPQLQRENDALRQRTQELQDQLNERITLEDFLAEVQKTPDQNTDTQLTTPNIPVQNNLSPSPQVDIAKLVDEHLQTQRKKEQVQANVSAVEQELVKAWGSDYRSKLVQRAKDLDLSHEFLASVAEKSPKAFLNLVMDKAQVSNPAADLPVHSSVSLNAPADTGVRDQKYWDKIKKSDPEFYRSERGRAQRHKDAQRLGQSFFN